MIRRTFRGIVQLLGGLGAGLAIMLMVVAWQLSSGPISLGFLSPYIETAVNSGQRNFTLKMKDTILTWAGWDRTLDIRVLGVRILGPGGALVGQIPEVSFSLSAKALLSGVFAPRSIELFGPRLRVRREYDGSIDVGFLETEEQSVDFAGGILSQLLAAPDPKNAMSYLTRLEIVSAEVTLVDQLLGKSWVAPSTNVSLRRDEVGIIGEISTELDIDNRQTRIAVSGGYHTGLRRFDLTVNFSEVSPAAFSSFYYELGPLHAFDLPLKGTITVGMTLDGKVENASFDLTGGKGVLNLPAPAEQSLAVEKVVLSGSYKGAEEILEVDELKIELGPQGRFKFPAPNSHEMPLSSVIIEGRYLGKTNRLEITRLDADLRGPTASLTLVADGFPGFRDTGAQPNISIDVKGSLLDVPVDQLARYWPAAWGSDAHRWITTHLSDGTLHQARAEIRLWSGEKGSFELVSLDGDMEVSGVSVDYLPPMPPVRNTEAYMKFDERRFDIFISKGDSDGLTVNEGTVFLTGLDEVDQYADIDLRISGAFANKLAYLDHEPLGYSSIIGIDPKTTKGQAETRLKLHFIVEKSLTLDQIEISATSKVRGVTAANVLLGSGIDKGQLDIRVDKKGMDVAGSVNFGRIPATLVWRENFGDNQPFRRRYDLQAKIADVGHLADMGLDLAPFTGKFVRGSLDAEVRYTVIDDVASRLDIKTDITNAEFSAPAFGWSKEPGIKGEARMTVLFEGERIKSVPQFSITTDDLEVIGKARYDAKEGTLRRIDFERISFGRTDIKGALIAREEGGWDAGFHGPSFDLSPLWEDIVQGANDPSGDDALRIPYLTLAVELKRVWVGPDQSLKNVSGTFAYKDEVWTTVLVNGEIGDKKPFELTIHPLPGGNRKFLMTSADAGETLKILNYYKNMVGGKLEISGHYNDAAPGRPLIGQVKVKNYRIADAPILTRVLSIMSLTGILEALQGDGLAFSSLDIPFVLGQGWMEIKDAKATGVSLGFTASGTIYTYADVIDVSGTVVPAYALNSALGHIPILGDIFTGGEKGGGVFAVNYTMSGPTSEPKVTVNPLSVLAPGIFRNVFDLFGQVDLDPSPSSDDGLQQEPR
ncbi:MAG: AsmA-like C-terminal domain-containing protein [Proteobacteria bacterium]|nr:AsmA-like C-terminal domain-containing protein [Pseudomonadota bacterium]